ncbi:aldehyde dehydrogenase [Neorhizobium sp. T786]|uniref:aldehyde dehydrogenase n=1 Tax=Pseudorhizobium xiangyangii TaxID=2883104 RepID=UPI001CFF8389|nr:aldehyde dehydrogenase [Neorhizobium xiangyangii]MCB5205146.1 aldehyde dehydrogenase [Neorhizobium xiangyangii]
MTDFSKVFIGGRRVASSSPRIIEVRSPYDGSVVGTAPLASREDIDRAVIEARRAFDQGPWPRLAVEERIQVIERFHALYEARSDEFARFTSQEMGAPHWFTQAIRGLISNQSQAFFKAARSYAWEDRRVGFPSGRAIWLREPVGVVAAIIPWNAPHQVALGKLYPALIAGCTVVLKLAEETAVDGQFLGELFTEAGVPEGVISILAADKEVSEHLVIHPGVDKIGFTGSSSVGRRIASLGGAQLKRVSLELGGKSAAIVLEDADLAETVAALKFRSFPNNGQVCVAQTRVLVPRARQAEWADAMVAMIEEITIGDPTAEDTFLGPVVSERQRQRITDYIHLGEQEGARVATGGAGSPDGINQGNFIRPTLFIDVDNDMRIAQEEIFGPVVCMIPYDGEDEAIALANASDYGLSGSVWTSDATRAEAIARKIRTGGVTHGNAAVDLLSPFGGFKQSGIGREFGSEGINHYVEHKTIAL